MTEADLAPIPVPENLSEVKPAGSFVLDRLVPILFLVLAIATLASSLWRPESGPAPSERPSRVLLFEVGPPYNGGDTTAEVAERQTRCVQGAVPLVGVRVQISPSAPSLDPAAWSQGPWCCDTVDGALVAQIG